MDRRIFATAAAVLVAAAALVVAPATAGASQVRTPDGDGAYRAFLARPRGGGGLSASALTAGTDTKGDVAPCQGDIDSFTADLSGSDASSVATFGVHTVCANDPYGDATWTDGYSFAGWLVDTNGDNSGDYLAVVSNDGATLRANLFRVVGSDVTPACAGTPTVAEGGKSISGTFSAPCLGSPPSLRVNTGFQYDQYVAGDPACGTCSFDEAPNGQWGPTTVAGNPAPAPAPTTPAKRQGYWMIGRTGDTYAFGDAKSAGNTASADVVDLEPTRSGNGYWTVNARGNVYALGDAGYFGGTPALEPGETVTALSRTADGGGYWLFTSRGRVVTFGNAPFLGDMSGVRLNGPVLDSIPTPTGQGYYMVGSDGGIFTFGDAAFYGSMGSVKLNAPVQSLVPDQDGTGYWLVASDGGIFAFESEFYGSMGDTKLNKPVTGMVGFGKGYLMVAEDGGIFTFGDAPFFGSLGANPPAQPIVSVAILDQA